MRLRHCVRDEVRQGSGKEDIIYSVYKENQMQQELKLVFLSVSFSQGMQTNDNISFAYLARHLPTE